MTEIEVPPIDCGTFYQHVSHKIYYVPVTRTKEFRTKQEAIRYCKSHGILLTEIRTKTSPGGNR